MLPNPEGRVIGSNTIGPYTYGDPVGYFCNGNDSENCGYFHIGSYTSIGKDAKILCGGEHHTDWVTTYPFNVLLGGGDTAKNEPARRNTITGEKGDVVIGSDVWLGNGCTILNGVTIHHGCIIGAGAVIARDCEPYGIYIGNPSKLLRHRYSPEIIEKLLEIRWWEHNQKELQPYIKLLQSNQVNEFIKLWQEENEKNKG